MQRLKLTSLIKKVLLLEAHTDMHPSTLTCGLVKTHLKPSLTSSEQSRRDDLEALGYVLIYFMKGLCNHKNVVLTVIGLPWANLNVERKDRRKVIGEAKAKTPKDVLTEGLPGFTPSSDFY